MHTEEEAKRKYCPLNALVFSAGDVEIITGRNPDSCISSECMMWQWLSDEFEYLFSPPEQAGWLHDPYVSASGEKIDRWRRPAIDRRGFCGLARR